MKKNKNKILFGLFLLCSISLIGILLKGNFYHVENYRGSDDLVYTNIYQDNSVTQFFYSSVDNLDSIAIKLGTYQQTIEDKTLDFTLRNSQGEEIRKVDLKTDDITDNTYVVFSFDKIGDSKGKLLSFELQCRECEEEEKIAIYGKESNQREEYVEIKEEHYPYQSAIILTGDTVFLAGILVLFLFLFVISFYFYLQVWKNEKIHSYLPFLKKKTIFYIIYFLLSGLSLGLLYVFIIHLYYHFTFSYLCFGGLLLCGEILLFLQAYQESRHTRKIEDYFLLFAIPIGLGYLLFLPPTHVPDEIVHYASAYKITQGVLEDTGTYVEIPKIVEDNNSSNLKSYQQLNDLLLTPPNGEMGKSTASGYSIVSYLPSIIGLSLGEVFHLPYFVGFYLARILTFIVFLLLAYFSIKILPIGKLVLTIYFLNPMWLQQAISVSADSMMNMFGIFYICYILYLLKQKKKVTKKQQVLLLLSMLLVACMKYVYIPLVLLSLLLLFMKKEWVPTKDKKRIVLFMIASILVCIGLYILHAMTPTQVVSEEVAVKNISLGSQLSNLLSHPFSILRVFINTIGTNATFYWDSFFGVELGWFNISIDRMVINIYILLLLLSPFLIKEKEEYTKWEKIGMISVFAAIFLLTIFGMYLTWTSVGASVAEGVQGRYFLPIAILPFLLLCNKKRYLFFPKIGLVYTALIIFVHFNVINTIIHYFL